MNQSQKLHQLDKKHSDLDLELASGAIGQSTHQKGIMLISLGYAQTGSIFDAVRLVSLLDDKYINTVLPQQMEEDPKFGESANLLAEILNGLEGCEPNEYVKDVEVDHSSQN